MPVTFLKKSWNFLVFAELQFHIAPVLTFRKLKKQKKKKKNVVQLNKAVVSSTLSSAYHYMAII